MLKFGLHNLRRLTNIDPVELKPITILVGRNSSGKSSFLRTLPLIRQSLSTRISSPILWYGDFVDFGSFESSSGSKSRTDPIIFSFELDELTVSNTPGPYVSRSRVYDDDYKDIRLDVSVIPFRERTRISEIKISIGSWYNTIYILKIDEGERVVSLSVNGVECLNDIKPYVILVRSTSLFPDLLVFDPDAGTAGGQTFTPFVATTEQIKFYKSLNTLLKPHMDGRIKREKIDSLLVDMIAGGFPHANHIRNFGKAGPKVLTNFLNDLTGNDTRGIYGSVERVLAVSALVPLLRAMSAKLRTILVSTLYIGPARARSERYYRYQDLAVSEIDPDGKNLPIFLNSLTSRQIGNLSNWINSLFDYGISISRERDHISIKLIESNHQPNIVDVGYGISQILPVLGQIWWAKYRPRRQTNRSDLTMLAIEQPELHLHPAHQALLADAFVGIIQATTSPHNDSRVHYIVETHSETLINRLGELVAEKKIEHDDVQIILFERDMNDDRVTNTKTVNFDAEGALVDWPFGFFQPNLRD